VAQTAQEIYNTDVFMMLVQQLQKLDFEVHVITLKHIKGHVQNTKWRNGEMALKLRAKVVSLPFLLKLKLMFH